ncbi:MAG TPA: DUF1957 domain-containing protein [Candidatus Ozemobacteraceae bacterium]|nr:DUF1957 domain-containing protein [Candidatus Ozemobacteraceae bacterium]
MKLGSICLVLHAHLPFVRHPEHEDMMEERWLFEAITETYIPLLDAFEQLHRAGVDFRITMSLTPPLTTMLSDPLLQERYARHLGQLIELAEKELDRTRHEPEFQRTAQMYYHKFQGVRHLFEHEYQRHIVRGFRRFQDLGKLEVMTCCATHGYLPLMELYRPAVRAQIEVAVRDYERQFGRSPRGIWLSECAYNPGDDAVLADYGLRYFFTDAHGILHAQPRPKYGVFAPIRCPSGVCAFGRDLESSKQVWSAEEGYPGDPDYREFYRDIGFDLDLDYVRPYIHESGIRLNTGIKYHRITGRQSVEKAAYDPQQALDRAATHAGHFLWCREKQVEHLHSLMGSRNPIIVSPYDAELFGHWWYEGPDFLRLLLAKVACDSTTLDLVTPSEYLERESCIQPASPSASSWGHKGYHEVWLEGSNDWIYRHLHKAAERMIELADRYPQTEGTLRRALNQAARELLLAQSSDWAFIMKTGTTVPYAVKRTKDHCHRFTRLYEEISGNRIDESWLQDLESRDNIFPEIDYRVYCSR